MPKHELHMCPFIFENPDDLINIFLKRHLLHPNLRIVNFNMPPSPLTNLYSSCLVWFKLPRNGSHTHLMIVETGGFYRNGTNIMNM